MHIKKGDLVAADQMLTGLHSDTPATALRGVLMRAQLAVTSGKQQQVIVVHQFICEYVIIRMLLVVCYTEHCNNISMFLGQTACKMG